MNDVIPFAFDEQLVRVILRNGDPWFVAADVCRVLGINNAAQAVQKLDDDEFYMLNIGNSDLADRGRGNPNTLIVSESGLYTIVLRSRAATTPGSVAHRFRRWVTGEVLPSIRKTGTYAPRVEMPPPQEAVADRTTKVAIDMVHQARMLWGKTAAKRLWDELGLPQVHAAEPTVAAAEKWNPQSPLTLAQEEEIRQRYRAGGVTMAQLAEEYGVTQNAISRACRRPPHH